MSASPASVERRLPLGGHIAWFGLTPSRQGLRATGAWLTGTLTAPPVLQSGALLILAVLASAGVMHMPVFVDEAENVLGACQIARGSIPYRDFFSHHLPLPYYLLASIGAPGACSVLAARYLGLAAITLAMLVFTLVTRNPLAPAALLAMALAGPSYYAQLYLAETVVSVGLILTLALLTDRSMLLPRPLGFGLRLIAFFILASSSQIGLMMTGILWPLMLLRARGQRLAVAVAGGAALAVWPVSFLAQGALSAFVDQGIVFNTQVYSRYLDIRLLDPAALLWQTLSFARHRFSFVVDWLAGQGIEDPTVASFAATFELALLLMLAGLIAARRGEVALRVALCLLLPLAVARDGFHLAPFVTLASVGSAQLMQGMLGRSRAVQAGAALIAVLALRIYFFFLPMDLGAPDELARSLKPDAPVLQHTAPDQTVLYLPIAPGGYLATDRRPGSFYSFFLPWQADLPDAQDRLIADIERNRVAAIVLDPDTAVWEKYRFRDYAPRVYAHILSAYRPLDSRSRDEARVFVRTVP